MMTRLSALAGGERSRVSVLMDATGLNPIKRDRSPAQGL
jgi:hypothetical protein